LDLNDNEAAANWKKHKVEPDIINRYFLSRRNILSKEFVWDLDGSGICWTQGKPNEIQIQNEALITGQM
jgi:hypothetical protein